LLGLLAVARILYGQVDQANLTGTISDPAGLPIKAAEVDVLFGDTGLSRSSKSSESGTYVIAALPVGECAVTIRAHGFQTQHLDHLTLSVGETRTLDVQLGIEQVAATVDVPGAPVALDRSSAVIGDVLPARAIEALPLNGRNWATLMTLSPGAVNSGAGNPASIRFAGRGLDDNKLQLDGVDATGILHQAQKTDIRLQISADSIAEFRVNGALYTAEYGAVAGAQIYVASKTGTNEWHGSAFEYLRNGALDARSLFDPSALPPFRLNQFGGSLGGPILRNRSFIFVDFEGLRQILGQTLIGFVPSAAFRSAAMAQSPQLQPLLSAYPAGTTPTSNPQVDRWAGRGWQTQHEASGIVRFDQRFSDKTTAYARWTIDGATLTAPLGDSSGYLRDSVVTSDQPQNGMIKLTDVVSLRLIHEVRVGVNRVPFATHNNSYISQEVVAPGFTTLHDNLSQVQNSTTYSVLDTIIYAHDRHVLKAGVELRRVQINLGNTEENIYSFTSAANFIADKLGEADLLASVPTSGVRKTESYGFVQDEFKVQPNFTLNTGVRYESFGVFSEPNGRARAFDPNTCGGFCPAGASFYKPDLADIGPRLGVTWAPSRFREKTVFRAGSGLYYGEGQLGDLTGPLNNLTRRITLTNASIPQLTYPVTPFIGLGENIGNVPRALDRDRKNQRIAEWGLTLQQQLPLSAFLEIGYLGSKGTHLFTRTWTNIIDPNTGQRPLPQYGLVDYKRMDDNSEFHALLVRLHRRFGDAWWSLDYMWSHSIDDGSLGGGDSDYPENVACQRCERASSDQDVRQDFIGSIIYPLPFSAKHRFVSTWGWVNRLIRDWQIAGLASARTGLPLTVSVTRNAGDLPDGNNNDQRPDLVPGISLAPPGGQSPALWINPAAFSVPLHGAWGNAGRNLIRAPGAWQVDTSLTKRVALTDHLYLDIRGEIFNLFNHPQYGLPNTNLSAVGSFGQITQQLNPGATGTGTPRQIQFALRLGF
jgi:hypothetical protein